MTIDREEDLDDDFLASVAKLRTLDVSPRRSHRLRGRCHAMLQAEESMARRSRMTAAGFRPNIIPALGASWCLAYVVEIIRCTGAIYGYFGAP
jgi:hypothetical protein